MKWLRRLGCLPSSLTTCVQFPEPPWDRDRTNSHKLSPDLGMGTVPRTYIHKNLRKWKGRKEYEKGHPRILGKLKFFFNVYEYFAGEYICAPGVHLVPYETRRKH